MSEQSRRVLVAYDGSPDADRALAWAAATALAEHRPLRVLMVADEVDPHWQGAMARAEKGLAEAGFTGAGLELTRGPVARTLLEAAEGSAFLVSGSRGRSELTGLLLGSVSSELARKAACPVVVVRRPASPDATRIVVGVDGSPDSRAALEFACRRAEISGETVAAVHAWHQGQLPVDKHGNVPRQVATDLGERDLLLAESVAGVRSAHPDVVLVQEPIPVSPGDALVDASSTASLVVTGSRGRGPVLDVLLGSVSQDVLRRAHCPVAIVR